MAVQAKFKLNSYTTTVSSRRIDPKGSYDSANMEAVETRSLKFLVVTSGSPENDAFFLATPSGSIELSTVNPEAWAEFDLNKNYIVTFTPAD